jgi:hypothetical protein
MHAALIACLCASAQMEKLRPVRTVHSSSDSPHPRRLISRQRRAGWSRRSADSRPSRDHPYRLRSRSPSANVKSSPEGAQMPSDGLRHRNGARVSSPRPTRPPQGARRPLLSNLNAPCRWSFNQSIYGQNVVLYSERRHIASNVPRDCGLLLAAGGCVARGAVAEIADRSSGIECACDRDCGAHSTRVRAAEVPGCWRMRAVGRSAAQQ